MPTKQGGLRGSLRNVSTGVIPESGVSRYQFADDSDTSVLVDSWGNNNGTLSGGSYVTDGVSFDGADDFGDLPNATVPFATPPFSIALKFSAPSSSGGGAYYGLRNGSTGNNFIFGNVNGEFSVRFFDGADNILSSGIDFRDGTEHLGVFVCDSEGSQLFYDDGNSGGTGPSPALDLQGDDPSVGRRGGSGGQDNYTEMTARLLDSYDKRLTQSEVSNLWQTGEING